MPRVKAKNFFRKTFRKIYIRLSCFKAGHESHADRGECAPEIRRGHCLLCEENAVRNGKERDGGVSVYANTGRVVMLSENDLLRRSDRRLKKRRGYRCDGRNHRRFCRNQRTDLKMR